jgi:ABC-type sugar transport system ATPase subunit
MASLTLREVQKSFGEVPIIRGVDLEVKDGVGLWQVDATASDRRT